MSSNRIRPEYALLMLLATLIPMQLAAPVTDSDPDGDSDSNWDPAETTISPYTYTYTEDSTVPQAETEVDGQRIDCKLTFDAATMESLGCHNKARAASASMGRNWDRDRDRIVQLISQRILHRIQRSCHCKCNATWKDPIVSPSMNYNWLFGPVTLRTVMTLVHHLPPRPLLAPLHSHHQQQPPLAAQPPQLGHLLSKYGHCMRINWSYSRKWTLKRRILIISSTMWDHPVPPHRHHPPLAAPPPGIPLARPPQRPFMLCKIITSSIPMALRNTSECWGMKSKD